MASETVLLVLLCIANAFVCFGPAFATYSYSAIQDIIQAPRCSLVVPNGIHISNCCATCLGFSPVEFNLLFSLPIFTRTPVVLAGGYAIDRIGVTRVALVSDILSMLGDVTRLVGVWMGGYRWLAFGLIFTGQMTIIWIYGCLWTVRNYVAGHFFPSQAKAAVAGITNGITMSSGLIAYTTMNHLGQRFGSPAVAEVSVGVSLTAVVAALALCILRKALNAGRTEDDAVQSKPAPEKPTLMVTARAVTEFRPLLLILAIGLIIACLLAFILDSVLLLVDLFHLPAAETSTYAGIGVAISILAGPLAGWAVGRFGMHAWAIAAGGGVSSLALLLLLLAPGGHPMLTITLFNVGYPTVLTAAVGHLSDALPRQFLGSAIALSVVVTDAVVSVLLTLTGVLVQKMPSRRLGWIASVACIGGTAAAVAGIGLVLAASGRPKEKEMNPQRHEEEQSSSPVNSHQ